MRIRPDEVALDDGEWRDFLDSHDFGQLITAPASDGFPCVVPAHFHLARAQHDVAERVVLHLAVNNPALGVIARDPRATVAVVGAYVYVPSQWAATESQGASEGVPTSYYGAVQLRGRCRVLDDPDEIAGVLRTLLGRFQPEGGYGELSSTTGPYSKLLRSIRGIELEVEQVAAKFKFGGNRTPDHQRRIADSLIGRGDPLDREAVAIQMRRLASRAGER